MNSQQHRNWSDIILLLLLPAPLTGLVVILGLVYVIAAGTSISLGDDESPSAEVQGEIVPTLSANVAAIATLNAAPDRVVPPPAPADPLASTEGVEVATALGYTEESIESGRANFLAVCASCHGVDALGMPSLGKTLVNSEFIRGKTDEELLQFVIVGRQSWEPDNTTGVQMPPRGGNPGLTDEDINHIIAYIRVLDGYIPDGTQVAAASTDTTSTDATTTENTTTEATSTEPTASEQFQSVDVSAFLASLGVTLPDPLPQPERTGESLYNEFCGVRYGEDLGEVPTDTCDYLMTAIESGDVTANQLFEQIALGHPIWENDEPAGVQIPVRGGYPEMTNADITLFLEYLYSQAGVEFDLDPADITVPDYQPIDIPSSTSATFEATDTSTLLESTGVEAPESHEHTGRDGETLYAVYCTEANATVCEYLVNALKDGESDDTLFSWLISGVQIWDVENPPLSIPLGGGNPPMTETEIRTFIEYLHTLAG